MTNPLQPSQGDAVGAAQTLAASLDGMAGELKKVNDNSVARDAKLTKQGRRTRLGLALDIVLTIVIALLAVQNNNTAVEANATRTSSIAACESTNVARAENQQLWDFTLTLFSARPDETAAEKAAGERVLASLRAHVMQAFKPRDCEALYGTGGGHD